jgi:hypothetical protein
MALKINKLLNRNLTKINIKIYFLFNFILSFIQLYLFLKYLITNIILIHKMINLLNYIIIFSIF